MIDRESMLPYMDRILEAKKRILKFGEIVGYATRKSDSNLNLQIDTSKTKIKPLESRDCGGFILDI